MTSPIADMLTRMRNALAVHKAEVDIPFSRFKAEIAKILKEHNYITNFEIIKDAVHRNAEIIHITLKYHTSKKPAITSLKIISKPGKRVYANASTLPVVLNNLGIAIISTSQGIITSKEAKKRKLGGEVVCEVY